MLDHLYKKVIRETKVDKLNKKRKKWPMKIDCYQ